MPMGGDLDVGGVEQCASEELPEVLTEADHGFIIAAQQKMHVMPMLRKPTAIIAADRTGTDDGDTAKFGLGDFG